MTGTPGRIGPRRVARPLRSPRPPSPPTRPLDVAGFRWAMKRFGAAWAAAAFGQVNRVT